MYDRLRQEQPDAFQKLIIIESNLDAMNMSLSQQDRNRLLDTNIIFHGATIMRSNQKLRVMTNVNVFATKEILQLAKEMTDLKVIITL